MAAKRILVVEDERLVALDLQRTLQRIGYDVPVTAATAAEATAAVAEYPPDLLLLDIRLRDDDGIALAERLAAKTSAPVVFLTAYADDDTLQRAREVQPHGYLIKPIKPDELRSTVEIVLHRHEMEAEIRRRDQWLHATLQAMADAVIAVNADGRIRFANAAAEKLTGASAEHACGRPVTEVLTLLDERTRRPISDPLLGALASHGSHVLQNAAVRHGDDERPVEGTVVTLVDADRKLLGAVMAFRDAGPQRAIHQGLAMADRFGSLGTLAAGVGHEINNPLTVIVNDTANLSQRLAGLQQRHAGDPPLAGSLREAAELVQEVEMAADRVARIIADLKRFGRPGDDTPVPTDLRKALGWALRIVANEVRPRAQLTTIFEAVPAVIASDIRLGQVFVNLLLNAVQSIGEGAADHNEIRVRTYTAPDGNAVVSIRDTGCGMAPDVKRRAFEPYFTTRAREGATGLGLAIAADIVKTLGGSIAADSAVGTGSVFRVILPPSLARAQPTPQGMPAVATAARRGKILVVDDDPAVLRAIKVTLGGAHDLTLAANADEALRAMAADPDFDLVLCDWLMPGLSGVELFSLIQRDHPVLADRVVFMSGGAFTPKAAAFFESVANPLLAKPFNPRDLAQSVQNFLARRAGAAA